MTRLTVGGIVVGAFAIGVTAGMLPGYIFGVGDRPMNAHMSNTPMPAHMYGMGAMPLVGLGSMPMGGMGSMMYGASMQSMHDSHHGWSEGAR